MAKKYSDHPTGVLLDLYDDDDLGREDRYLIVWELIGRFERGIDVPFLGEILNSPMSSHRLFGSDLVIEMSPIPNEIARIVEDFADNPLQWCRYAFIRLMGSQADYNDHMLKGLSRCLNDMDLFIRVKTIQWAVRTRPEVHQHFCNVVESWEDPRLTKSFPRAETRDFWRASAQARAARGLEIVRRVRDGEPVDAIRRTIYGEDSFVFDWLASYSRREREAAK